MAKRQGSPQQKPKRNPGRPNSADAGDAKDAILQAARRLLQDDLPAQVTNSMIAREAGADPALIRYYFGSRSALLLAVIGELMKNVRQTSPERADGRRAVPVLADRRDAAFRPHGAFDAAPHGRRTGRVRLAGGAGGGPRAERGLVGPYATILKEQIGDEIVDVDPCSCTSPSWACANSSPPRSRSILPLAEPGTDPKELADRYQDFVVDLFLNGLRKR